MLDTTIVSDLIRNPKGKAACRLRDHGADGVCISIISAGEVRYGAAKAASSQVRTRIEAVLAALDIAPIPPQADHEYGQLRTALHAAGTPIGANDLWIAAHALALSATLITNNLSEFSRVPGLAVQDWLE